MNCKQAQRDIALWAGQDLDDAAQKEAVRRHVSGCPCCRMHYQRMKQTLHVLERAERPVTYTTCDSLWPELATRINGNTQGASRLRNTSRFNGWMPLIAMTAAGFILLLVVIERPAAPPGPANPGLSPSPIISAEGPEPDLYRTMPQYHQIDDPDADVDVQRLQNERLKQFRDGF